MATSGSPLVMASTISVISQWSTANDVGTDVEEATLVTACGPSSLQQPGTAHIGVYTEFGSPKIQSCSFNTSPANSQLLHFLCKKFK
jgi:hypothetical protein